MKLEGRKIVIAVFLLCVALFPYALLFWQESLPVLGFKLYWMLYPVLLLGVGFAIIARNRMPQITYLLCLFTLYYLLLTIVRSEPSETVFRLFMSVLPFTFIQVFYKDPLSNGSIKLFWIVYCCCFSVPIYYAYLQYTGEMPYFEYDYLGVGGRISGGYNKPMNFIANLFPIYLAAFYFILVRRSRILGYMLIFSLFAFLVLIGHRTSLFGFFIVFISSFFRHTTTRLIYSYYKNFLNFFVGVFSFFMLYLFYSTFGLLEVRVLRGRFEMWTAHADTFFSGNLFNQLFGFQKILLDPKFAYEPLIGPLAMEEAHNNTFRIIVFFGVVGYFLYCLFMRWLVIRVYHSAGDSNVRFIRLSCFTYLILYTITNEPMFYGAILYPLLICTLPVFVLKGKEEMSSRLVVI